MSLLQNSNAIPASGDTDFYEHQIANSIRADTNNGYLHRTPSSAGNRATWTFSTWIKLAQMGTGTRIIYSAGSSGDQDGYYRLFYNANKLIVSSANANFVTPSDTFRDPSAWYHILWKQGSNATTLYVNGEQIATASVSGNTAVNNNTIQCIGTNSYGGSPTNGDHLDGYFAETIMIDGTALDPDSFISTVNGVIIPKEYNTSDGAYGTNGFRLAYNNASDLGEDSAGSNDWTAVNLATHDQMLDTPTFGSSNGGNFATLNPLAKGSNATLSEGNLRASGNSSDGSYVPSTMAFKTGKWYCEFLCVSQSEGWPYVSIFDYANQAYSTSTGTTYAIRYQADDDLEANTGDPISNFGTITLTSTGLTTYTDGDIIGIYIDCDNKKAWFTKNGSYFNSGDPSAGTNPQASWTGTPTIAFMGATYQNYDYIMNFGQDGTFAGEKTAQGNSDDTGYGNFYYAPDTGFLAMCAGNLPVADAVDPAQTDDNYPQKLFGATTYTGNATNGKTITLGFQTDFNWTKQRSATRRHVLMDTTRGMGGTNTTSNNSAYLHSEGNYSQGAYTDLIRTITSTGYTLGDGNYTNANSGTYASWNWRANGGTTSTNSNGSTDSTVQVDPSGHFSIVKFEGQNDSWSNAETIGHGLSSAPTCMILKNYDKADEWQVFFSDYGSVSTGGSTAAHAQLVLNTTAALYTNQSYKGWGGVMPTSTVFTVDGNNANGSGESIVVYCFANCEGYIKSGTYVGNGDGSDGTFVYTGFRPAWVMVKKLTANNWRIEDNARDTYNPAYHMLLPNSDAAEDAYTDGTDYNDFLSNGFKLARGGDAANWNASGATYAFLAMAHNPFKYATAR